MRLNWQAIIFHGIVVAIGLWALVTLILTPCTGRCI